GRPLPEDPNPTWNGYSTAHWEDDTLVIETNGIRDDMWLDIQGSPVTESARVTERLKRLNFGLMQVEIAVDDPKAYAKPWSVTIEMAYQPDTTMLEEICLDDEQNVDMHLSVTTNEPELARHHRRSRTRSCTASRCGSRRQVSRRRCRPPPPP